MSSGIANFCRRALLPLALLMSTAANAQGIPPLGEGSWVIQTVDSEGEVGWSSSMALDKNGRAHISYFDKTRQTLKYAIHTGGEFVSNTNPSLSINLVLNFGI